MQSGVVMEYVPLGGLLVNLVIVLVILPLRASIAALQQSDDRLSGRIQALELRVADQYVKRDELTRQLLEISTKLDRITERLYGRMEQLETSKVDKHP